MMRWQRGRRTDGDSPLGGTVARLTRLPGEAARWVRDVVGGVGGIEEPVREAAEELEGTRQALSEVDHEAARLAELVERTNHNLEQLIALSETVIDETRVVIAKLDGANQRLAEMLGLVNRIHVDLEPTVAEVAEANERMRRLESLAEPVAKAALGIERLEQKFGLVDEDEAVT